MIRCGINAQVVTEGRSGKERGKVEREFNARALAAMTNTIDSQCNAQSLYSIMLCHQYVHNHSVFDIATVSMILYAQRSMLFFIGYVCA